MSWNQPVVSTKVRGNVASLERGGLLYFRDIKDKQLLYFTLAYLEFVVYFEGVDFVEYFVHCPGYDPLLRVGCWSDGGSGCAHRVRLAGTGLSIGKHCHVIT